MEPYDHDRLCPKCRFIAATTAYHEGYHGVPCAFQQQAQLLLMADRFGAWAWSDQRNIDALVELQGSIPEHFDRTCPNCGYLWAEAPEDVDADEQR